MKKNRLGRVEVVPNMRRHPFLNTVVLGAAAALGGAAVSLLFSVISKSSDHHRLIVPQAMIPTLPPDIARYCVFPSACSLQIR